MEPTSSLVVIWALNYHHDDNVTEKLERWLLEPKVTGSSQLACGTFQKPSLLTQQGVESRLSSSEQGKVKAMRRRSGITPQLYYCWYKVAFSLPTRDHWLWDDNLYLLTVKTVILLPHLFISVFLSLNSC